MYFSSEDEINDSEVEDDYQKDQSKADNERGQLLIALEKLDLKEKDRERIWLRRGIISLSFPNAKSTPCRIFQSDEAFFPPNYTSTTSKERLLLLFAENFRRQYNATYEHRRPLVLAVPNQVCFIHSFSQFSPCMN